MQEKIAERLRKARKDAGYANAREAAAALQVEYPTYAAHENGSRAFGLESAALYCRRFKVSIDWLVTGHDMTRMAKQATPSNGDGASHEEPEARAPASEANIIRLWDLFNRVRRASPGTQVRIIGLLDSALPRKRGVSQTPAQQAQSDSRG